MLSAKSRRASVDSLRLDGFGRGCRTARTSLCLLALLTAMAASGGPALAQQAEAADSTRLDVERLPPEAIQITRDMYAVGLHVRAELGGQGFAGGVGRISRAGPLARLVVGYELSQWFALGAQLGLAFHATHAPQPPAPAAFQVYTLLAQARFQLDLGARAGLWIAGEGGAGMASGNFLQTWGYDDAGEIGLVYGGTLGFDWHLVNAHHSLGLAIGAHHFPKLSDPSGEASVAIESAAYLKYVF